MATAVQGASTLSPKERAGLRHAIEDPVKFARGFLCHDTWPTQEAILRSVATHKRTAVKACHASSKTFTAAEAVIWWVTRFSDGIAVTTAPTGNQVKKIMWPEIRAALANGRIRYPVDPNLTELPLGDKNYAIGFSTDEGVNFQGFHGRVLVVIDEAPGVVPPIWEAIEGARAGGDVRMLALGNPTVIGGPFYDAFTNNRKGWNTFTISAFDTPNFRGITLEDLVAHDQGDPWLEQNERPYLITRDYVREKHAEWGPDTPMWQARILGQFPKTAVNAMIPLAWVEQCLGYEPDGWQKKPFTIGCDVARYGDDDTAFVGQKGGRLVIAETHSKESTMETAGRAAKLLKEIGNVKSLRVDDTGLGGGVTDRLREQDLEVVAINFGSSAFDDGQFADLRTELWWNARRMFEQKKLGIPNTPAIARLIGELTAPKYKLQSDGRIRLESKDDMKKRGLRSPDLADAFVMAIYPEELLTTASVRVL